MKEQGGLSNRGNAALDTLKGFGFKPEDNVRRKEPRPSPGEPPIDQSVAENWCIRPELIALFQDAFKTALTSEHLSYSDSHLGDTRVMKGLSQFINQYFNPLYPVESSHIALAPGSSNCLAGLLRQICDPGDGVLIPAPFWNGFDFHFTVNAQVHPVVAPVQDIRDSLNADAMIASLTNAYNDTPLQTRALILTNPGNPIGQCYTKDLLERCVRFCQERNIHLICDEVYALTCFGASTRSSASFQSILSLNLDALGCDRSRVHVVWSLSKDFGCSGIRLGCVVSQSNPELILALRLPTATEVSSLSTLCTTALLTSSKLPELIKLNTKRLNESYRSIINVLTKHDRDYIPATAGLFVFALLQPQAKTADDEAEFQQRLKEEGIIVSPGRAYHLGSETRGWYRLTFALEPGQLNKAMGVLDRVLQGNKRRRLTRIAR